MQHVPLIVVKHIDARPQLPRGSEGFINTCEALVGSPVDPRKTGAMDMFLGVAGSLRDGIPETGLPAKLDQVGARRPSVSEEAPKKPRIRLSNAGEGVRAAPRSSQGDTRAASPVENAIMVADYEVQPRKESAEKHPSAPAPEVQDASLRERSTLTPVSSPSGPFAGPETSSRGGQRGLGSSSSSTQYFARSICWHLD
ncbi:hypothetical protein AXF42_Ash002610 [Apostasia shenzhenica]|uniref:Uncharacterized protein n=1 Tax=Apostasia shenzhenica TaxID=1088818 RepID=A0A2I0APA8_9ASPA|nr:hypothetical protein AXF42_Ash002610 [Apostasia shenzhenica]